MEYYRARGHHACTCIRGWTTPASRHPRQNKQPIITLSRSITSSRKARSPWLPCCRETIASAHLRNASRSKVRCILRLATFLHPPDSRVNSSSRFYLRSASLSSPTDEFAIWALARRILLTVLQCRPLYTCITPATIYYRFALCLLILLTFAGG